MHGVLRVVGITIGTDAQKFTMIQIDSNIWIEDNAMVADVVVVLSKAKEFVLLQIVVCFK